MRTSEEKLAKSLSADSIDLIPYLPYLLQDIWELGSSPRTIMNLIEKHIPVSQDTKVLDLACGKGAVSIQIAQVIGCQVKGLDIIPEFIDYAKGKAQDYQVENHCKFFVRDIHDTVYVETDNDIVILGAAGDIFGDPEDTILKLKRTIKPGGHIIIDDSYGNDGYKGKYPTRNEWLQVFQSTGVQLLEEIFSEKDEITRINEEQQSHIRIRACELKKKYPDKADMFDYYIKSQMDECNELENELTGVTILLKKIP